MYIIKTLNQFYEAISEYKQTTVCLFFVSEESQPCKALEPILIEECNKKDILILKITTNNCNFFNLIIKYSVGSLPKYIFIKKNKILYSSYGLISREDIKNIINKIGEK